MQQGPLKDVKIVEFAGIGPAPFCTMLLADMGAHVLRIDRPGAAPPLAHDILRRSRKSVALDLKDPKNIEVCLQALEKSDALIEGFRPGVMEKLGLGPEVCLARNPRLVYGRMTGWGQQGPLAKAAGHDINYIALTGALAAIGTKEHGPVAPLNLVGDFGGGALYLAMGMCAALLETSRSGKGQVIDCAMTDGAASLMSMFFSFQAQGFWNDSRESNLLDGGAHFYGTYETKDGQWIALGSIEPQFYALLRKKLGLEEDKEFDAQMDRKAWPILKKKLAHIIKQQTREAWISLMENTDVCFAPVLSLGEVHTHPHNKARGTVMELDGVLQPAPAPRFSRTPSAVQSLPAEDTMDSKENLLQWGLDSQEVAHL